MVHIHFLVETNQRRSPANQGWRPQPATSAEHTGQYLLTVLSHGDKDSDFVSTAYQYFIDRLKSFPGRARINFFFSGLYFMTDLDLSVVEKLSSLVTRLSALSQVGPFNLHSVNSPETAAR